MGLSPLRSGLDPRLFQVLFLVDKVALEEFFFLETFGFCQMESFHQCCKLIQSPVIGAIQGVSKIHGQTSRMGSSHQNKEESSYKHMSGNEWFFIVIERLH